MTVPKNAPASDFAFPPDGLYVGDAEHAHLAVQAFTTGLEGNKAKIPENERGAVKGRIAAAVRKFFTGAKRRYYLSWLETGKKPDSVHEMFSFNLPNYTFGDTEVDVETSPAVSLEELIVNDPKPLFVTRPLGVLNAVSDHGLVYDEQLMSDIERQTVGKTARQGHVKEEDRASAFPDDVGVWVGVKRIGDTLWGKCYIYPGTHFHTMVRGRQAAGGTLGNSIWGNSDLSVDEDGVIRSRNLVLQTIDFCDANDEALKALGGEFFVTSEMANEGVSNMAGEQHSDAPEDLDLLKRAIASIDPAKVMEMLPEGHRKHVAEAHMREMDDESMYEMMSPNQRHHVSEMHLKECAPDKVYEMLSEDQRKHVREMGAPVAVAASVAEMGTLRQQIAEMDRTIKAFQRDEFDRAIDAAVATRLDWKVVTPDGESKLSAAKKNFRVQLVAEMAGSTSKADIESAATRAWETFKPLAEMTRSALAGPSAVTGTVAVSQQPAGYDNNTNRYDENVAKSAASRLNLL